MTHKISPIAFRLGVSSSWLSSTHITSLNLPLILHSDMFIRELIEGILLQFSYFTSPIIIKRSPNGSIEIDLFFWDATNAAPAPTNEDSSAFPISLRSSFFYHLSLLKKNQGQSKLAQQQDKKKIVSKLIYLLISKLYKLEQNGAASLTLHMSEIPSPVLNAKILCDYLAYRISLNPYSQKALVMEALRATKTSNSN